MFSGERGFLDGLQCDEHCGICRRRPRALFLGSLGATARQPPAMQYVVYISVSSSSSNWNVCVLNVCEMRCYARCFVFFFFFNGADTIEK